MSASRSAPQILDIKAEEPLDCEEGEPVQRHWLRFLVLQPEQRLAGQKRSKSWLTFEQFEAQQARDKHEMLSKFVEALKTYNQENAVVKKFVGTLPRPPPSLPLPAQTHPSQQARPPPRRLPRLRHRRPLQALRHARETRAAPAQTLRRR